MCLLLWIYVHYQMYAVVNMQLPCVNYQYGLHCHASASGVNSDYLQMPSPNDAAWAGGGYPGVILRVAGKAEKENATLLGEQLFKELESGKENDALILIAKGADVNYIGVPSGYTPLMLAAVYGMKDVVAALLNKGAEVNYKWANGQTPLMVASFGGKNEIVEMLLKKGADVNARSMEGYIVYTALTAAIYGGYANTASILIKHGADVNAHKEGGMSELRMAMIQKNRRECVDLLLQSGAVMRAEGQEGVDNLYAAGMGGYAHIVKLLVERGANVNGRTAPSDPSTETTPLIAAVDGGSLEAVKILLEHGSDVNAKDADGMTPMHHATTNGNVQIIDILLKYGGVINVDSEK